jgi:hypothetical protein
MEDLSAGDGDEHALEVTAGALGAVVGWGAGLLTDPVAGVVVTPAATEAVKAVLTRFSGLGTRRVAAMWQLAVEASEQSHEDLLKRVTTDPHRAQLFLSASQAAASTALETKLRVLGRLLADGLIHEDVEVDEARLLLSAIEGIERAHLRVLDCLSNRYHEHLGEQERAAAKEQGQPDAWPFDKLAEELGVSRSALELTVGTLAGNNLVHGGADTYGSSTSVPQMVWGLTAPGWAVLERFRSAGEETAGADRFSDEPRF